MTDLSLVRDKRHFIAFCVIFRCRSLHIDQSDSSLGRGFLAVASPLTLSRAPSTTDLRPQMRGEIEIRQKFAERDGYCRDSADFARSFDGSGAGEAAQWAI
ncbi:hypothetical protein [Metapseudomonas resinovorans]|uniref:hypothetical protein n=1 Tax=Metapseudomonas resinovorans TaxID=53412 RepID=UPI00131AD7FA|nr:hypothetical protein [Pseudomonas resinovorans]